MRGRRAAGVVLMATKKDTGKTSTALGVMSALVDSFCERGRRVGYMKPVGHEWREVERGDGSLVKVDKDVLVFQQRFELDSEWSDMSPIVIDSGMTRRFLDGEIDAAAQMRKVEAAYERISADRDFIVVEGTGHAGVGSIIEMNNAKVASALGLDAILVAPGGLGSSFDELATNKAICDAHGVKVRGVILNKVAPDKCEMISSYFAKALARWDVPLLGCVPFEAELDAPCASDFERLFGVELLSGAEHRLRHFAQTTLVSTTAVAFAEKLSRPRGQRDATQRTSAHGSGANGAKKTVARKPSNSGAHIVFNRYILRESCSQLTRSP
jgi:dethiobiotin synthase